MTGLGKEFLEKMPNIEKKQIKWEIEKIKNIVKENKCIKEIKFEGSTFAVKRGTTADGKKFMWNVNNGMGLKSRLSGTLFVDGKCVYKNTPLEHALLYLAGKK
jgi:hypothetical protein